MKDKAEIDTDFEKFYFISSEFDDPLSLDNWNEKCLLILDEADKGFDLRYQVDYTICLLTFQLRVT